MPLATLAHIRLKEIYYLLLGWVVICLWCSKTHWHKYCRSVVLITFPKALCLVLYLEKWWWHHVAFKKFWVQWPGYQYKDPPFVETIITYMQGTLVHVNASKVLLRGPTDDWEGVKAFGAPLTFFLFWVSDQWGIYSKFMSTREMNFCFIRRRCSKASQTMLLANSIIEADLDLRLKWGFSPTKLKWPDPKSPHSLIQ